MIGRKAKLIAALVLGTIIGMQPAALTVRAEDTNAVDLIKQLLKRIEELEQKVKVLEHGRGSGEEPDGAKTRQNIEQLDQKVTVLEQERKLEQEANATRAKESPKISIGQQGFYFGSANGDYGLQIRGTLQVDSRTFFNNSASSANDGLLLRRARPIIQGKILRDFEFLFLPDFAPPSGPQILDAYVNYKYSPGLQFQVGKFRVPVGLEILEPDRDTLFNERALTTALVPSRDLGFDLHGDLADGRISYAAGVFNGTSDGASSGNVDFANDRALAGRLFFQPLKKASTAALQGIGCGLAGSYETMSTANIAGLPSTTGGILPGYFTAGQQQFFAFNPADKAVVVAEGNHWRMSPQGYYYYGPFGLLADYVISDQGVSRMGVAPFSSAHLANTAWEVSASWVLTGEDATYAGGVVPRRPFDPANGGWGAWQLVGRFEQLDIDAAAFPSFADPATSARSAAGWSLGINWYLNRNARLNVSYSHTTFGGGGGAGSLAPATVTRRPEEVLFTRVQLAF